MSALGQKQTFAVQNAISALPPKADIERFGRIVRFMPEADIALFDHLVGACEQRGRHLDSKRFCGLQIDDELELGQLQDW
jgi:hypothetical protein